jgi:acyl dehydratase
MNPPPLSFGPITPATLAAYAVASHDHNLIHLDDAAARRAGFEGTIVHGMLPMAIMARSVTSWVGPDSLIGLSARFTAPTPANAVITVTGRVRERVEAVLTLILEARTGDGTLVVTGTATVRTD